VSTTGYPRVDRALAYYYAIASHYDGLPFSSLDELIEKVSQPGMSFPRNFDAAMNDARITEPHLKAAMESVALTEKGNFQYVPDQMFQALIADVLSLKRVASDTFKEIAVEASEVADTAITTAKRALSYGPYILVGAAVLYLLFWMSRAAPKARNPVKNEARKVIKKLREKYGLSRVRDYSFEGDGMVSIFDKDGNILKRVDEQDVLEIIYALEQEEGL
jgi:hypothetical protein